MTKLKHAFMAITLLATVCLVGCGGSSDNAARPTVNTQNGQVVGVERNGVNEYRGIPYGVAQRWSLATAAPAWQGAFDAANFGPACPQQARFNLTEASSDENCLSINVSTPKDIKAGEKLPVFFWIHGGAFIGGSSNLYRLDKLAREGRMVVVSMNYRLGALGFMPNPSFAANGVNGNYGLEDQRLAMRWVQQNIEAFGGDKTNVTIAGESAGGGSVCMHLASPDQVSGLFTKAIVQSAGCMATLPTVTQAQAPGKASATIQAALCPGVTAASDVLSCMRSKTVDQILTAQGNYTSENPTDVLSFSPVTGDPTATPPLVNATVPSSFAYAAANNKLVVVPLMAGGTKDELRLYVGYYWQSWYTNPSGPVPDINNVTIGEWLRKFYGSNANTVQNYSAYASGFSSANPDVVRETLGTVLSDYNPAVGINNCLDLQTSNVLMNYATRNPQVSAPIYQFEFADPAAPVCKVGIAEPCPTFEMGAVHSSELNYLFPNLSNTAAINAPDLAPASQVLANQMVAYWARFAYTGNPNTSGLPNWPLYNGANTASVQLLKPGSVGPYNSDAQHQCSAFWSPLYFDQR